MKKTMFRALLVLSLAFASTSTADAQIGGVLSRARNRAQQVVRQTAEDARQSVEDATVGQVKRAGQEVQRQAQRTVDNAVDATVGQVSRTVNGAVNQVTGTVNNAVDGVVDATVGQASRTVNGVVNQASRTVNGAVNNAVDGVVDATVGQASRSVYNAINGVTGGLRTAVNGAVSAVTQPVVGAVDGITTSATGAVVTAVDGMYESVMARSEQGRNGKQATGLGALPVPEKVFKPSKKATQADAQAANTDVPEGYTKSVSAIHGAYEHLDAKLYPYQPYYQFPDYYVMHSNSSRNLLDHDFSQLMGQAFLAAGTSTKVRILSLRRVSVPKQREGHNFCDETVRNAYSALFVCDPMSIDAFGCFVRTLLLDDPRACPIEFPMDDPAKGIISEADNFVLAFKDYNAFLKMRANRRDQALAVARSTTPINIVRNAIEQWIDAIPEAGSAVERYTLYWLANEAYEEVLTQHDKYVGGDEANLALGAKLNECRGMYSEIIAEGQIERIGGTQMPASYNVSGVKADKLKAAAEAQMPEGLEILDVVCLDKQWKTGTKSRTMNIGVVTQVGRFKFLFSRTLTEAKKGRNWSGVYTVSGDEAPVKLTE